MNDFFENTTVKFSGVVSHDGSNPDITNDTVTFLMKLNKTDTDTNAAVNVNAINLGLGGAFDVILTPSITKDAVNIYFYEFVWLLANNERYILESGTVKILNKVQDNV